MNVCTVCGKEAEPYQPTCAEAECVEKYHETMAQIQNANSDANDEYTSERAAEESWAS